MRKYSGGIGDVWRILPLMGAFLGCVGSVLIAQTPGQSAVSEQVQKLNEAIARTQSQLDESQHQLNELRRQLSVLEQQLAQNGASAAAPAAPPPAASTQSTSSDVDDLRDRAALQESQIATLDQEKVQSESRYPVQITGLLLLNGFVNTRAVDLAATPTIAVPGGGSTGASMRQTVLGFDARGPHLFGARSYADLRVDFDGNPQSSSSGAIYYYTNPTLLRLRTAHAGLQWRRTEAYFAFDRPIFSPDSPTSLTAVAEPALAWSGNLWAWNPQFGAWHDLSFIHTSSVRLEAALMDVGDPPITVQPSLISTSTATANGAEKSRWPGVEAHAALLGSASNEESNRIGFGGYFATHHSVLGYNYDAWAGTLDARLSLPARLQFTGSAYRGLALGGLGGGAYKDFAYREDQTGNYYLKPLDDVGGWAQLKEKVNQRVEFNAAFGMDNVMAHELRRYASTGGNPYLNLARNRTYSGNVIFSPSAYLLFSLEYRHLVSAPVIGLPAASDVIGLGAGYKF